MSYQYSPAENATWQALMKRRRKSLPSQACNLYLQSFEKLKLPDSYVPSLSQVNKLIQQFTDWTMMATTELVGARHYFKMLSTCKFPVITTIRPPEEIDFYSNKKPDVIHEYFGHAPFLTSVEFTNFMQGLAKNAMGFPAHQQPLLGRLFWFTIEFGLINTEQGLRAFGAGIIPSESEARNALYSNTVEKREFRILDVLRTPFSTVGKQNIYYVIPDFDFLYSIASTDLSEYVAQALKLGDFS